MYCEKGIYTVVCSFHNFWNMAQINSHFGLKAGLTLASQNGDNTQAINSIRPCFIGGKFYQIEFFEFFIQPTLVYSLQGSNTTYVDAGIYAECAKSNYHAIPNEEYKEQAYTRAYSFTDYMTSFGAGWKFDDDITIDEPYNLGLTSTNDSEGIPDTKNNVFSITNCYVTSNLIPNSNH